MKKFCIIIVGILLLIGVVYLFSIDNNSNGNSNNHIDNYSINHYIDTINGHIILTTVCDDTKQGSVSVSTLEIDKD